MADEEKGFVGNDGERVSREVGVNCKTGLILYKGYGDYYYLDLPNGIARIGNVTTMKLIELLLNLQKYDGNLDKAYEKTWEK